MASFARNIAKNASVIAGATLISRGLGFLRDVIAAYLLGAGPQADAFYVAFRLPNLLRSLFAEGSLTMAFVPIFTRTKQEQGEEAAFAMARSALAWVLLLLSVICVLAIVYARPLTMLVAPGFRDKPEILDLTVLLVRLCFPYIFFISGVAVSMGVLNSLGHFFSPAMSPVVLNVVLISTALWSYFTDGNVAVGQAVGVLIAGLGQWLLQQPYLGRLGFSWRGAWSWKNEAVRRMGKLMGPSVFGAAVYQMNILLGTLLASLLPTGSVSYLYYADRLVQFPLGVFGVAVGMAALPNLASLAASNKIEDFKGTLNSALGLTLFIGMPAAAGLIALSHPIIAVLFNRGAFSPEAVNATAAALMAYSAGLPAFACVRPLVSAFYSLENTRTPVLTGFFCMILNISLGYVLMQSMGHVGLALAASISSWANVLILGAALTVRIGSWWHITREVFLFALLSLGLGAGAWSVNGHTALSLACILPLAALYLVGGMLFHLDEAMLFRDIVRSRLARRAGRAS